MPRQLKAFVVLITISAAGMLLGGRLASQAMAENPDYYESLDAFSQVLYRIRQDYVEAVDVDKLILGAINGMVKTLDPYSQYMTPEQYEQFQEDTTGDYSGIGVEITQEDDALRIIAPYPGSPAERAGIEPNDRIIKVDSAAISDIGPIEAVSRIKGRKGTKVLLTIRRDGWTEPRDIPVERDQIHTPAVQSSLLDKSYGYVRVIQFQERVSAEVQTALRELEKRNKAELKGVLLDLRDNPGGLLDEAVKLSDLFIDKGIIVKTEGRRNAAEVAKARSGSPHEKIPLVVLINEGSASASEIVAGALQDHRRAILVGERSFGKGSVQNIIRLDNSGALRLTVARYYTPNGRPIDTRNSIVPDVVVALEPTEPDAEPALPPTIEDIVHFREASPDLVHDSQLKEALAQLKSPTVDLRAQVPASDKP